MTYKVQRFHSVKDFTGQITRSTNYVKSTSWKRRKVSHGEDVRAKSLGQLMRKNLNLLKDSRQNEEAREACYTRMSELERALDASENKTPQVKELKKMLNRCIWNFAPQAPPEKKYPEVLLIILTRLPAHSDEEIRESLKTFRNYHITNPSFTNEALAEWINQNQLSIGKLQLSYSELCEIGPWIKYLDLRGYDLEENQIHNLIKNCPKLHRLFIKTNKIKQLPKLPAGLKVLNCSWCRNLQQLPELPAGLEKLNCSSCDNLQQLPNLPSGLEELYCIGCRNLQELPKLPAGLKVLYCIGCSNLQQLPELPAGLIEINRGGKVVWHSGI